MLRKLKSKKLPGFTLLELVVVIVVIGILAAIAIPTFQGVINRAHDASAQTTLQAITRDAQAIYAMDQGTTPADWYIAFEAAVAETPAAATSIYASGPLYLAINIPITDLSSEADYDAAFSATSMNYAYGSSTKAESVSVSVDEVNNLIGLSYTTASNHCAFATLPYDNSQAAQTWSLNADIGVNCRGSVALQGQAQTESSISTLQASAVSAVGTTGIGGGTIVYDAGQEQSWGRYIEVAPSGWYGTATDPELEWWSLTTEDIGDFNGIGQGLNATNAILAMDPTPGYAASASKAYTGGGQTNWHLPTADELNLLQAAGLGGTGGGFTNSPYASTYDDGIYTSTFSTTASEGFMRVKTDLIPVRPFLYSSTLP